jgi:branched-chain amino acid transport system substrate-binding protein
VQVFVEAATRAGSIELGALVRALHEGAYDTVLGPITFNAKGDVSNFEYAMYRWHDGSYEEICCRPSGGG